MNYSQLRQKIFFDEIKQLMAIIGRLGVFVAAVCYQVVIPVFLMFIIFGLAQIAEADTAYHQRVVYQSIYFICIYGLVRVQRGAILASNYQYYLQTLPVKRWQIWWQNSKMCLYGANLLLIAPIALCLYIPNLKVLIETQYFVAFSGAMVLMSQIALYRQNVPWVSLLLMPFVAFFVDTSPNSINWWWLLAVVFELMLIDKLPRGWFMPPVKHYLSWLLLYGRSRSANIIARQILVLGVLAIHAYLVMERPDFDTVLFAQLVNTLVGLVWGSYQFEIERIRQLYRDYLALLPLTKRYLRVIEGFYLALLAGFTALLCMTWLGFSAVLLMQLYLIIGATAFGVIYLGKYYFVMTLIAAGVFIAI